MKGKGCVDQIFTLRMIVEKCLDVGKKVFAVFVDLEKAYDRVNRRELWQVLCEYGVRGKLLDGVRAMYENSKACVRVDGKVSEWFTIEEGVRQGCVISPWLFNVFMDACMRRSRAPECGLKIGDERVCFLLYADDTVLLAESVGEHQTLVSNLEEAYEDHMLRVNVSKITVRKK